VRQRGLTCRHDHEGGRALVETSPVTWKRRSPWGQSRALRVQKELLLLRQGKEEALQLQLLLVAAA
jgi:hypothetical protein